MFSAEGINKGSIIHNEKIIYLIDENKLDEIANQKSVMDIHEEKTVQLDYTNPFTKAA